jgi:hypothetical protein
VGARWGCRLTMVRCCCCLCQPLPSPATTPHTHPRTCPPFSSPCPLTGVRTAQSWVCATAPSL